VGASDPSADRQGNHRHHQIKMFFDAKRPTDVEVGNILIIILELMVSLVDCKAKKKAHP